MSEHAQDFVLHLQQLAEQDRGALAALRRSVGFPPGAYPPAFPHVERFVPPDSHAEDSFRLALYIAASLFALLPKHQTGQSLAAAFGKLWRARESDSVEKRFITLLDAEPEQLPNYLRQAVTLLAADGYGLDYQALLRDLNYWLSPWQREQYDGTTSRDKVRRNWARDFYRQHETEQG
ncbi:type I-E CRISPR-associated protein Cse2/CasB [Chromobacterium violaceum]|uniref:type I-E CRISPR-associated protein Cse2/CasB n=1 Tax=Chromobacterium violaceum TaxID=536 RepID=UPI0005B9F59F|nr:type I-E CRISPR-associated protein Cse2/CasB [Chromobacterium violaceum]KJH65970.1 CRISPR-associated protein Cse2 [Chromobacterium violaceum]